MSGEPILGIAHPEPLRDYTLLTWKRYLRLRGWAQRVGDHEHAPVYPVYMAVSALTKSHPRDLDVSIILPHARFVAQFGPIPPNAHTVVERRNMNYMPAYMSAYMRRLHVYRFVGQPYWKWMIDDGLYMGFTRIDLTIRPDSWWPEKPKLLLAPPREG